MLGEKHISKLLRYAVGLPALELKTRNLRSEIIDLEFKKKDLTDTLTLAKCSIIRSWPDYHKISKCYR